ncbi:MAG: SDR family NAD(P)-dependent oxidoreductase [Methylovulum sp.]|nr:SDR family NAD(P)-dependent oxidoreductase [Methylovulum sp.]
MFVSSARNLGYSATKTAMHSMTQTMRYMLRNTNVRVLEIIPGPVDTDMSRHYNGPKTDPQKAGDIIWRALLGREDDVVIGLSGFARLTARLAPRFVFKQVNDGEFKVAGKVAAGH